MLTILALAATAVAVAPVRIARSAMLPRAYVVANAKESLMSLGVPLADTPRQQSAISELVLELEKSNPTPAPARSEKLDGTWSVKFPAYYGGGLIDSPTRELALMLYTGGLKPGLLLQILDKLPPFAAGAVSVDRLSVTFTGAGTSSPMAEGTLGGSVLSNPITFTLRSSLSPESDTRLRETYVEATLFDQTVGMPGGLQLTRNLMLTYLDDDLLVIRDESGAAEVLERTSPVGASGGFSPMPMGSMAVPTPPDDISAMDQPSDLEAD